MDRGEALMPVEAAVAAGTMEITVSKFELLRELTATQGVVERKTTIPILSNYLFEAAGDRLSLTATDLDLSLRTSCNAKVKKEGSCTIPARKLHDYVKLLPDADITIKLLENHWVSIRCGRSNTKMVGMAKSNFPSLPAFPTAGAVTIPAQVLRGLIARTGFAISNEESRYTLNGALMLLKPESITMVATDGHRLAHCERPGEKFEGVSGELKTLVPKKAMDELKSLLDSTDAETIEFAKDDSTETGESEDSIEAPYTGDPLTIGFNAQYLVEFLKAAGTSEVRLELKDPQSAGQFRPAEGDDYKYRYIVMPMRI